MPRSSRQLIESALAFAFAAAPLGAGVIRLAQTGSDFRYLVLALVTLAASFLVMRIGKASTLGTKALFWLAAVAFAVGTLIDVVVARLLGANAAAGIWMVAVVFALLCAVSQFLFEHSRHTI